MKSGRTTSECGSARGGRTPSECGSARGGRTTSECGSARGGRTTSECGSARGGRTTSECGSARGGRTTSECGSARGGRTTSECGSARGGRTTSECGSARGGRTPSGGGGAPPRRSPRLTSSAGAKPRISVQQLRKQKKAAASQPVLLQDPLAPCDAAATVRRGATGLVYDERLLEHCCPWDDEHPESPDRLRAVFDRCAELGLVERCVRVPAREATDSELQSYHSEQHVHQLQQLCETGDPAELREAASQLDSVYFHPATFRCAALAAGSVLELTDRLLDGSLQNAFAIVRPPGHHATRDQCNGYSYLNHVALAARRAVERGKRVLVVDWDVHHGQGTQRAFYDDDRVLYFSTHRYDRGAFWPHLAESDFDAVGDGAGAGYTWNVPLDMLVSDADLLAIWHRLLLPAAYEFAPDLVIVSAGFDAALGDPKGGMAVTPACFGHLTHALLALAGGRLLAVLEGGYCLPAVAQAAAHTLQALLGEPPPPLVHNLPPPCPSVEETIRNVVCSHRDYFHCFSHHATFSVLEEMKTEDSSCHWPPAAQPVVPPAQPSRDPRPTSQDLVDQLNRLLLTPAAETPTHRVCLVTNEQMMRHRNVAEPNHPERPERLSSIMARLDEWGLAQRCHRTSGQRRAAADELLPLHEPQHVASLADTAQLAQRQLDAAADKCNSVFLCPESYDCALLASGCVMEAVDSVLSGESGSGLCVVRPPGHHAEPHTAHGFCLFNNVAVAARHACQQHGLSRVLIVDWDVHHGNGIQHMFYSERDVMYASLHRHDHGFFFPMSDDGNHDRCGEAAGRGYTVNVPWNKARMSGAEYLAALTGVLLPVAYQFAPQLVLVAAGFDAARGDPLGGYSVPPEVFGHMTHHLAALAGGRIILTLEGGYDLTAISYSMAMCARALLGDPPVQLAPLAGVNESAARTLRAVSASQRPHWPAVADLRRRLPAEPLHQVRLVAERRRAAGRRAEGAPTEDSAGPDREAPGSGDVGRVTSGSGVCGERQKAAVASSGGGDAVVRPPTSEPSLPTLDRLLGKVTLSGDGSGGGASSDIAPAVAGGRSVRGVSDVSDAETAENRVVAVDVGHRGSFGGVGRETLAFPDGASATAVRDAPLSPPDCSAVPAPADPTAAVPTLADAATAVPALVDEAVAVPALAYAAVAVPALAYAALAVPALVDEAAAVPCLAEEAAAVPSLADEAATVPFMTEAAAVPALADDDAAGPCLAEAAAVPALAEEAAAVPALADDAAAGPCLAEAAAVPSLAEEAAVVPALADEAAAGPCLAEAAAVPCLAEEAAAVPALAEEAAAVPCLAEEAAAVPALADEAAAGPCLAEAAAVPSLVEEAAAVPSLVEEAAAGPSPAEEAAVGAVGGAAADWECMQMLLLQEEMETMYAVIPLPTCPHLDTVFDLPSCGIDANMPCNDCADSGENWVCLTCYQVFCGRYRACHMLNHASDSGHCMVLSLADLSVWCYVCQAYVHNERLIPAKRAAHRSKFGVDMPGGDAAR